MPKWLLFSLAAVVVFVIAVLAYNGGRVIIPVILGVAAVCFIMAASGSARKAGGGKG